MVKYILYCQHVHRANWRCRTARHALSTEVSIFIDENIIFIDENTSNVHEEVDR
jgi:hypothetical protein